MRSPKTCRNLRFSAVSVVLACAFSSGLLAQVPDSPVASHEPALAQLASIEPAPLQPARLQPAAGRPMSAMLSGASLSSSEHKFWDKKNTVLFAASAAMSGADFAVTRANLQKGGQELNPVVRVFGRSSAGLAVNFAGETAGIIAVSYFFHRTGHHSLERLVSVVNMGASAGAVSYGMAHR